MKQIVKYAVLATIGVAGMLVTILSYVQLPTDVAMHNGAVGLLFMSMFTASFALLVGSIQFYVWTKKGGNQ